MSFRFATAAACLLVTAAPASADLLWGINGHPVTAYPGIPVERQLDFIKDLGLKSYRINVTGEDNADVLADLVDAGKARGIEILPVITPADIDLDKDSPDELYGKTRKLAIALGTRFKNDIRVWELGNEMENYAIIKPCENRDDGSKYPCGWGPAAGSGALDYYGPRWGKVSAVLRGLSEGMTAVDPGIRKAMGTSGWGHTGAFARMQQDGIVWDISVWHMYGEDPEWAFREISRYGKPIWVTEFNNPYGSQRSERQQGDGIKQTMTRLRELNEKYKIEAAQIYELFDEAYWAPGFEANMGLVRLTPAPEGKWRVGEPKPAYKMVRDFTRGPQPLPKPRRECDPETTAANKSMYVRQASFAYCLVLGHEGDTASVDRWSAALESGDSKLAGMIMEMMRADDFETRYATIGLTDRAYVGFLFLLLLDRPADDYGIETYARQLRKGTMTREDVAFGILDSSEFKSRHAVREVSAVPTPG
ncbi:DUF4214 domain-containing protein [Mesorhizobium abyssinicae]|uniref:DUF4214 domain-containing protein n=1 Tax=Mesorhizobium TaxID=68287 RepID=UPI000FD45351|nr:MULTISPECIES: DUF4214 domain-containing protein [Mesorhizobium]RVC55997.1 DUF4214 domain-containing protein [Mesorhizobium sp. M4B.F.Ca.ET.088.02.2.1]MDX8434619.1 DUF4214 domain-containing protein [Mesorhizobium abyssinicae]RWF34152.1 MAG: DUF4214 domain-containing protein [Mesorhizobium sp.]RWF42884.1 MAG: DUF4214 domain-containing protein [Mesorhizobium sp.]TIX19167.1 MAG: DUF4214 domain-containing protein [Mesorhizobium sp.]